MATTVGATIHSDELAVAQSDKIAVGTEVQTLVIEFDQSKYEEFLSSGASSPVKTRKCRRVSYETSAPVTSAESSRVNLDNQPMSLDKAPKVSQQAKKWIVKQSKPTSEVVSQVLASGEPRSACVKTGPSNGPLSRRARQRQRQNQARRRARALVSLDGFHYRPKKVNEPRQSGEPRQHEVPSKMDEPRPQDERRRSCEPRPRDEPRPNCEPRPSGVPRRQREVPLKKDEPRLDGEPRHHCERGEPRHQREPRQQHEVPSKQNKHHSVDEPRHSKRQNDETRHNEPRHGVSSKQDERRPVDEPRRRKRQNDEPRHFEPNQPHEVLYRQDEPRSNGEPRHKPRRRNQMRRQPRQARQPLFGGSRLCETRFSESTGGTPTSDLREYLTRKRDASQMQSHCCCEKLISAMRAQCSSTHQPSVFERLSNTSARRRQFRHKKRAAREGHSPGVTINMVGRGRNKTPVGSPESSDPEYSPGLRGALIDSRGIYPRTRIRTGAAIPFDYTQLTGGTSEEFENSGIATSQPSNTDFSDQASVLMAEKEEEMAKKIEEQQALIFAQQESIRRLEAMMEKLVNKKKVNEGGSKSKREGYEGDHDVHSVSSEAESNPRTKEQDHTLRDFQKQLDALKLQGQSKELGVARPYPIEWDDVPYPPKFKPLNLVQFDGKSSPSQHIYYFQAQTGHITGNDPIMTRLFISTLKGVAFEWFRRLEPGSISSWKDLQRLFMARFFDDDTEVSMATLLAEKQKKTESVSTFVKRFRNQSLHSRDQVSEATLIEMCRNNLSINILSRMGAVEARSWRDLVWQGEQIENMLKRIEAEEPQDSHPKKGGNHNNFTPQKQAKGKETLAVETQPTSRPFKQKSNASDTRPQKKYDFKDDQVVPILKTLLKMNKITLPEIKKPEEASRTDDPKYCMYHRMVHHPTGSCYILKDKIQVLLEAGVMTLREDQKKVSANMVALQFGDFAELQVQNGVQPIPQAEARVVNFDLQQREAQGMVPYTTPKGEIMWVHPDLLLDEQWTSSKSKRRACNVTSAVPEKEQINDPTQQHITPVAQLVPALATRGGKEFSKEYPEATPDVPAKAPVSEPKTREIRYNRALRKDTPETSKAPFQFDVLTQLANIPARITLFELLRLSQSTREALREALADNEAFLAYFPESSAEVCAQCHQVFKGPIPCITFSSDDMQVKNPKHDRPLYFTGYIGSVRINRVQVDPGSALSIIPLRIIQHLGIPLHRLATTGTTIYGFNATNSRPLGKIKLKYQIGDLKTDVTCYVIDADTSYNLLLGRPWIHESLIVPSTLHQCMKYVDEEGTVKTLVAERQPFRGVENYFTDSVHYLEEGQTDEPQIEDYDSGNEADIESEQGVVFNDVKPFVIDLNDPDDDIVVFNESYDLAYASSVKSHTDLMSEILPRLYAEPALHMPIQSSFMTTQRHLNSSQAVFVIPAQNNDQKDIILGQVNKPLQAEAEQPQAKEREPQFSYFSPTARHLMEKMGYDFRHKKGLNYGKGIRTPIRSAYVPEGQPDDYYHKTRKGLGYESPPYSWHVTINGESDHSDHSSSEAASWDSDVSIGHEFKSLMANMTSADPIEIQEDDLLPLFEDPLSQQLGMQWEHRFEQREPPTDDKIVQINMGDEANPKPIFISDSLIAEEKESLIALVREYIDVFAWSYEDMPGLDPQVAMHRLNIKPGAKPVKQQQRRFSPQVMKAIEREIEKLIKAGFIREVQHPDWVSNIVPVVKKNGQIRPCVDYRDLNAACPKDDFPLPITDIIIDNTCGFERMSFMDGFSGYNQIKMHPDDEKHTAFRTPLGIYCYTVMPFGLKNAGATYQRAMTTIFRKHLRKTVECYVDDLVVKSRRKGDHLHDLKTTFEIMRAHQLKMNPTKSFLGMSSGKFLGFVVTADGIRLDPDKVKAIQELPPPRSLRELRGLQGRLAYIRRFISNLSGKCQPFSKLMKKGVSFVWDEDCQKAFEEIKTYLSNPPVLVAPKSGKPFLIYVRATEYALAGLLAQDDDNGHEQAVYYISRTLSGAEYRYPPIQKECLALVFAIQKMRHYLVGQTIYVISKIDPIRVFMTKPGTLNGRMARWALLLSQYDIHFKPQKAMKGQAVCDLMANHPLKERIELYQDMPDEPYEANLVSKEQVWQLFFDGAARATYDGSMVAGVGVVFVSPQNHVVPRAVSLSEPCTNNVAEYNALLIGLDIAKQLNVKHLEAFGDSQLIVKQLRGEYEVRHEDLIPYHAAAVTLAESFESFYIDHVPRLQNTYADALASLAATLALPENATQQIIVSSRQIFRPKYVLQIQAVEDNPKSLEARDWRFPIIDYVLHGILPEDIKERESIRRRASRFYYDSQLRTLYRRTYDGLLLRCLSIKEAEQVLKEAHDGICGAHQPGPKLWDRLRRLGYYWPTMVKDAVAYAKRCHACQIHANYLHQPPEHLHPTATSWPFETWGMDIVGPISPPSSKGHCFILAITDYFSKWAEAIPLRMVKTSDVIKFVKHHVIYRYGVPRQIVHDNGPQFVSHAFTRFCDKFRIRNLASTAYYPAANGQAEAFNKTIIKILTKMVSSNKKDWDDKLGQSLWAYRTTVRTPTGTTPYSLVYGCEAILPMEIQIPSLRIALTTGMTTEENHRRRLEELEMLDEKRLQAQQHIEFYQARISKAFDKKVRCRVFKEGDLVLAVRRPMILNSKKKGKFEPKWEGPFVVESVYSNGAYRLTNQEGDKIMMPINGKFLKKYYP